MGPEMMNRFRAQAERFGTRFITDDASRVELSDGGIQRVWVDDDEYRAKSVILAMGAEPKRLGIPGELELGGRGVSTCGVCDGAFFKDRDVVVIGGGDTAMEDSIFVSKYADKLTVLHRRNDFRASDGDAGPGPRDGQHRVPDAVRPGGVRRRRRRDPRSDQGPQRRDRRGLRHRGRRSVRRDRPHPRLGARRRPGRPARQRLRQGRGAVDADQPRRRLRDRRSRRLHLPAGGHRGRVRHPRRARRRVVPARHPADRRGADRAGRRGRERLRCAAGWTWPRPSALGGRISA